MATNPFRRNVDLHITVTNESSRYDASVFLYVTDSSRGMNMGSGLVGVYDEGCGESAC